MQTREHAEPPCTAAIAVLSRGWPCVFLYLCMRSIIMVGYQSLDRGCVAMYVPVESSMARTYVFGCADWIHDNRYERNGNYNDQ